MHSFVASLSRTKMEIYFVTSNKNKLLEAQQILQTNIQSIDIDTSEIQAIYPREVVEKKVMEAYMQLKEKKTIFVEDTGLHIKVLKDYPGALVKWILKTTGPSGICRMMKDYKEREAYAVTCIGLYAGKEVKCFTGRVDGIIVNEPRGQTNFGWDPTFQPNGRDQTFAEMGLAEKNKISQRQKAFMQLKEYLDSKKD